MASDPMNRTRACLICEAPQAHAAARVREAAKYLLGLSDASVGERRFASEAIEWLRSNRDEPMQAEVKKRRNERG